MAGNTPPVRRARPYCLRQHPARQIPPRPRGLYPHFPRPRILRHNDPSCPLGSNQLGELRFHQLPELFWIQQWGCLVVGWFDIQCHFFRW
jgi:hypothetical protein